MATKEQMAELLDRAAYLCVTKHSGQRDKMGCAYFQHPMRVAMKCEKDEEKIVALLHDTLEDTDVTREFLLEQGFPEEIIEAIESVTRRPEEDYFDFIKRAKQNHIGRVVKIHDLEDNLNVLRLNEISPAMAERFNRYLKSLDYLKL
ncbi:MAG: GTP pyrophosphokinase [Paramuribaculum sp.]|nr:GTP pyrophosphokinase [Paramuribaculum sp.]